MIRPRLEYAAYARSPHMPMDIKKLRIQRTAMKIVPEMKEFINKKD